MRLNKAITFVAVVFWGLTGNAQTNLSHAWSKSMGNSSPAGGNIEVMSVDIDAAGNRYVTGYFSYTADFDPGAGTATLTTTVNLATFIAKYDANGNYIFAKKIAGTSTVRANKIKVDGIGNIYITGELFGTADFNPGPATASLTSNGSNDVYLAKYDAAGNYLFAKSFGGTSSDQGVDLAFDAANNIYLGGQFQGTVDFDPDAGVANLTASGGNEIFFAKYNASGVYLFAKAIGGSGNDFITAMSLDGSNNLLVAGYFAGTADFDPGAGTASLTSAGADDIFFAKYDANGGYLFTKQIGGSSTDRAQGLALDATGNVFITGRFQSTVDFDLGAGVTNLTPVGGTDLFFAKYDVNGNFVFAYSLGGGGTDIGEDIHMDANGNIFITGTIAGTVDFDPGPGTANRTASNGFFVAKYDANAGFLYALAAGSSGMRSNEIAVDASGNATAVGMLQGTVDFDPGTGTVNLSAPSGLQNGFMATYGTSGDYVNAGRLGGYSNTFYSEEGSIIRRDASGNVYLAGIFTGTVDFDPGPGTANLATGTASTVFFAKYDASGNYVFAKALFSGSTCSVGGMVLDASGNIYLGINFSGTVDADPGLSNQVFTSSGSDDILVAKYDGSGNHLFSFKIGGASIEDLGGMAIDGSGNIYLGGYFNSTVDFDGGAGVANLTAISNDGFIAKYTSAGAFGYVKNFSSNGWAIVEDVAADASGNVFITGRLSGTTDFDPGAGTVNLISAGSDDIFFARYNTLGNYVYAKRVGGTSNEVSFAIGIDASGNAYITGGFGGTTDFDPGTGTANLTCIGTADIYVAKYDASGNYVFARSFSGTGNNYGRNLFVDAAGNSFITGEFSGTVDFDGGAGVANITSAGNSDAYIAKYSSSGNFVYAKAMGGSGGEHGFGIYADGPGNVFLTGRFATESDFDPNAGISLLSSLNALDIFIAKYTECSASSIASASTFSAGVTISGTTALTDGGCSLLATITPNGVIPVSGTVNAGVWIEPSVPVYSGQPYVARHYEITPASNAATATGRVTLYFTQQEFTDFNNHPGSLNNLPIADNDAAGKANLRVAKYAGTSSDGSGLPATYGSAAVIIDPADNDIVWNNTLSRWEVSFDVTGFSGFTIQSVQALAPLVPPANGASTISCASAAVDPGPPATIDDGCGGNAVPVLIGSVSTPATITCNGTVVWTYRYTACDNVTTADWTYTYTVMYSGGLTPPAGTASTVSCPAGAVNPGAPPPITDACGRTVNAVLVGSSTPPACEGTVVWTYRYTACDGTTTADWTHTYTIDRTVSPVITGCPSNITMSTNSGNPLTCSQLVSWTAPTAVTSCGEPASVASSHNPGDAFPVGTTTVTYTFSDCTGATATCSFTVTVVDNTNPIITCPSDLTVNVASTAPAPISFATVNPTFTSAGVQPIQPGGRTWMYANINDASYGGLWWTLYPIANPWNSSQQSQNGTMTFSNYNPATGIATFNSTVPYTYTNYLNQSVTINTRLRMQFQPYGAPTGGPMGAGWYVPVTASGIGLSGPDPGHTLIDVKALAGPTKSFQVWYRFEEAVTGQSLETYLSTINPVNGPCAGCTRTSFTGQFYSAGPSCGAPVTFSVPASDNCGSTPTVVTSPASGSIFPVGTTPVTATATDAVGNSSTCTFNVTVVDNVNPIISGTLAPATVEGCSAAAAPAAVTTVAQLETMGLSISDNCTPDASLAVSHADVASGTCPITVTRTYTLTDVAGNSSTASQSITVQDTQDPVITGTIPDTYVNGCASAIPTAVSTVAALEGLGLSISDCLPDGSLAVSHNDVTVGTCPRVITRTYTVTDACGNSATATHTIYVRQVVNADPALVDVFLLNNDCPTFDANNIPVNSVITAKVSLLNLNLANVIPSGTVKLRIELGAKFIVDPAFLPNIANAPLNNYFNWSYDNINNVIWGDQVADIPADFADITEFDLKAVSLGGATVNAQFQVTNHNSPGYYLIDDDPLNNSAAAPHTVISNLSLTLNGSTGPACFGGNNGSITVTASGGAPLYQYSIDNGATWLPVGGTNGGYTFTGLSAGTYTVLAKDAVCQQLTLVPNVVLGQPTDITLTASAAATAIICFGGNNGAVGLSATAGGGTPGYTYAYSWTAIGGGVVPPAQVNSSSLTGLVPGTYTVSITVTDNNGCVKTFPAAASATVTQPNVLGGTVGSTQVSCFGGNNGSITISGISGGSGSYQFSIDGGLSWAPAGGTTNTTYTFNNLIAGNYNVQIRDFNAPACVIGLNASVAITQPSSAVSGAVSGIAHVTCNGAGTGSFTIQGSGGTQPYEYSINGTSWFPTGGPTTGPHTFTGLTAGTYTARVRDANGCVYTTAVTITQPTTPDVTLGSDFSTNLFAAAGSQSTVVYNMTEVGGVAASPSRIRIFKPVGYSLTPVAAPTVVIFPTTYTLDNSNWTLTTSNSLYDEYTRNTGIPCNTSVKFAITVQRNTVNKSTFNLNAQFRAATGEVILTNNSNSLLMVGQ